MQTDELNELISPDEAAKFLGVSAGTLAVWRSNGRYRLPFYKVGHLVKYRTSDLSVWVSSRGMNKPPAETEPLARGRSNRVRRSA